RYKSFEGPSYTNRVEDLATQLFGHSWYHRGQIAALIRSLGGTPAETDYVFWTREPADESR
ncbi:damage-inducible protein DinB, partial [bacterium]|nr:damage-inducible protein DinB [bacterium]